MKLLLSVGLLAAVVTAYVLWVRPHLSNLPHLKELYGSADTFWDKVLVRVRAWWDVLVSAALVALPEVVDLLAQVQTIDLSAFLPGEGAKTTMQVIGIVLIVLRGFVLKRTSSPSPVPPVV